MPTPPAPLPPKPDQTRTAALKEWVRARNWRDLGGENRGFKVAGVAGLVGILLAVWFMSSWIYRRVSAGRSAQPLVAMDTGNANVPTVEIGSKEPADAVANPPSTTPDLSVDLSAASTPPSGDADPFVAPIQKKTLAQQPLADDLLPQESEQKIEVASTKPVSVVAEAPASGTPESLPLTTEEPKAATPQLDQPAAPKSEEPVPAGPEALPKTAVRPEVTPPGLQEQEVIEPVVAIEEKPKVVADNANQSRSREEEGFGGKSDNSSAIIERGAAKEPPAPVAEKPVETPAAIPSVKETLPEKDELPLSKPEERPAPSRAEDEPFGTPPTSTPLAPVPETAAPAESPKRDSDPVADKPVAERPVAEKPAVGDPPAVKAEPFSDSVPVDEPLTPQKPAAAKPKEMPPEEPAPVARPAEPDSQPAREPERPIVQPASRQQPGESPLGSVTSTAVPQIEFNLIAPLRAERGQVFKIGFQVTNIGTTDIEGLVFSIRLPPSLRHFVGRDIEYPIDRLQPGRSRTAQMHVLAEEADIALIRAEMTAGRMRLATSDRQILVRGPGQPGITQRPGRGLIVPAQHLAWPSSPAAESGCDCRLP